MVAHLDGELEARWRSEEDPLRNSRDTSKNRHATKHFHATERPLVQSFQPGVAWIWCYAEEVVMEPRFGDGVPTMTALVNLGEEIGPEEYER